MDREYGNGCEHYYLAGNCPYCIIKQQRKLLAAVAAKIKEGELTAWSKDVETDNLRSEISRLKDLLAREKRASRLARKREWSMKKELSRRGIKIVQQPQKRR